MAASIALTAFGLFAAGIVAGIIGVVCMAISREEKLSLTSQATDHVTRRTLGERRGVRAAAPPCRPGDDAHHTPAGQPGNQPGRFHRAGLRREWHGNRVARAERGIPASWKAAVWSPPAAWWRAGWGDGARSRCARRDR